MPKKTCKLPPVVTGLKAKQLIESGERVAIGFVSSWCHYCQAAKPALAEAACETGNCKVVLVNAELASAFAEQQKVDGFPTVILYEGGQTIGKSEGADTVDGYKKFLSRMGKVKKK